MVILASVTDSSVVYRPRRQLVATVDDGTDTCVLRFFSFYPSQQKALAPGAVLRIRGEIKGGFAGWQMVHPTFRQAGGALPEALTPVYPTVAGLPQAYLRKAVLSGLARADLSDTLPPKAPPYARDAWSLRDALQFLHHPPPDASLAAFAAYLRDRGESSAREAEAALHGQGENVVTLTTVHGARGLEWPVVFLCDLDREMAGASTTPAFFCDPADGIGIRLEDPDATEPARLVSASTNEVCSRSISAVLSWGRDSPD